MAVCGGANKASIKTSLKAYKAKMATLIELHFAGVLSIDPKIEQRRLPADNVRILKKSFSSKNSTLITLLYRNECMYGLYVVLRGKL